MYGGMASGPRRRPLLNPGQPRVAGSQVGTLPSLAPGTGAQRQAAIPNGPMQSRGYSSGTTALLDSFKRSLNTPSKTTRRRSPAVMALL